MLGKDIFRWSTLKKYEMAGGKEIGKYKNYGETCRDWCEVSIINQGNKIESIYFSHSGCLLSKACMNALIHAIKGKTKDEALNILGAFRRMMSTFSVPEDLPEHLKMFVKFAKFPSRKECSVMGCKALVKAIIESTQ